MSKLHFSWPQVSCVAGFPARGIRAVFVSYRDQVGEASCLITLFVYHSHSILNMLDFVGAKL